MAVTGDASVSLAPLVTGDLRFTLSGGTASPCFGLNSGVQSTQFDGLRCAIQNTRRHGGRSADSNGDVGLTNDPWGGEGAVRRLESRTLGSGFMSGQTRYFQIIHRESPLHACMRGLNTSQAVEIIFEP